MTDFALKLEGAKVKERKEWEKVRVLAYYSVLPELKNKKFERFMPFADEKKKIGNSGEELVKQVKSMMKQAEKSTFKAVDKSK